MNPNAIAFWALLSVIGYLIGDSTGALVGLASGLGLSLVAELLS